MSRSRPASRAHRAISSWARWGVSMRMASGRGSASRRKSSYQEGQPSSWPQLRAVSACREALDRYVEAGFAKSFDTDLTARALVSMMISMSLHDVLTNGDRREDIVSLIAAMLHGGVSQWVAWKELER